MLEVIVREGWIRVIFFSSPLFSNTSPPTTQSTDTCRVQGAMSNDVDHTVVVVETPQLPAVILVLVLSSVLFLCSVSDE